MYVYYSDRVLRLDSNSVILLGNSGLRMCLGLCCCVNFCEWVSWRASVCPDIVLQPVTASLPLPLLRIVQCKLMLVMDYSRMNHSWHSYNSIPPYWDQLHRMLSPIVPYSEYTSLFLLHVTLNSHTWLIWTLAESMSPNSRNRQPWTLCFIVCKQKEGGEKTHR